LAGRRVIDRARTYLQTQWVKAKRRALRALVWVRANVPPGLRLLLGLALIAGGLFGFLPILGFWMIPLGLAVAALDIRPLWRRFRGGRDRQ
jgi:hypothetical protein